MKELQIVLENCDVIKVPWENVINLVMCKVYKTYQYSKQVGLLEMSVAENICLVLSKNADLPHQEFGVGKFTTNNETLNYKDKGGTKLEKIINIYNHTIYDSVYGNSSMRRREYTT